MLQVRFFFLFIMAVLMSIAVACSSGTAPKEDLNDEVSEVDFNDLEDFDPSNFDDLSTKIDNHWFPLQPGTQWIYEGITIDEGESIPHRVIFTVSDLTKVIDNVRTIVAWDQDFADDELVETEIAFFAQDKEGNVWHFGQYPEEYEDGQFVDAPAWIASVENAQPGISMKAEPRMGTPSYSQGWAPAVDWTDRAQVYLMSQQICVPFDCYGDVLVIDEFSREEPDAFQQKYYARGVGNIRVGWRGDDEQQEELGLVDLIKLSPEELEHARVEVLKLEKRAYEISEDVYGQTEPSEAPAEDALNLVLVEKDFEEFDYDNFDNSTNIDNRLLPMEPGTQWVFEGFTIEDGHVFNHLLVFTVTDLTKEIDSIPTVVVYIEDYSNDELVEAEIAFYAQDNDGVVWYLGEYPEEYERGKFVDAPTWIAGLEFARAGIKMPVDPQLSDPSYSQGWAPAVQWSDRGQVYQVGQHTCVPFDCYEDIIVMDEFNLEEPGAIQLKYYAPDVGQVRVGFRGDDLKPEILELVERIKLDPEALEQVREAALALEDNAYDVSPNVYGQTPPAEGP